MKILQKQKSDDPQRCKSRKLKRKEKNSRQQKKNKKDKWRKQNQNSLYHEKRKVVAKNKQK